MKPKFGWPDDTCECGKAVMRKPGVGYVHVSSGYIHCVPGGPQEAMTAKLREYLEGIDA